MKKHVKIGLIAGILMCIAGAAAAAPTVYFSMLGHRTAAAEAAFPTPKTTPTPTATPIKPVISGRPVSISIPSVRINDVPVVDGVFDEKTQEWSLGLHTAHWGVMTPQPNDTAGNTYI